MENINYNITQTVNYRNIEAELLEKIELGNCEYTAVDVEEICEQVYVTELLKVFGTTDTSDIRIPDTIQQVFEHIKSHSLFFAFFKKIVSVFSHLGMEYDEFLHQTCSTAEQVLNLQVGTFTTLFSHAIFFITHQCIVELAKGSDDDILGPLFQQLLDETVRFHKV